MKRQKRKKIPSIPQKRIFSNPKALSHFSASEFRDQTGDASALPNRGGWPSREQTSFPTETEANAKIASTAQHIGRTWPDIVYDILIQGRLSAVLFLIISIILIVFLWQDNAAGRLDTVSGIFWTLSKALIYGVFISLLLIIALKVIRKN